MVTRKGTKKLPIIDSPVTYQKAVNEAIDWQYLTILKGKMATKPDLDKWLRNRYDIDAINARAISNDTDGKFFFRAGRDGIIWQEHQANRPAPTFNDYPNLKPRATKKGTKGTLPRGRSPRITPKRPRLRR